MTFATDNFPYPRRTHTLRLFSGLKKPYYIRHLGYLDAKGKLLLRIHTAVQSCKFVRKFKSEQRET